MKLPSPVAAYDFLIEADTKLDEAIAAVIRDLRPKNATDEIGIAFAPKERGGPVHCWIEFYAEPLEEGKEVITDEMRIEAV